ncbi:MAG TPA: 4-(cytidine 5'-diphospho)-2-C-methyl-D-erythritol kinase, partial [Candidatus Cloacimonadota bacterium]|nr:4-(cytidine 5'-diphospho)-2-C-methyl-D-erythritol kinase [Candidatus Cloacimonadota bacterium]
MQVSSYAKINLYLEVLGILPDNYHEVNTVFCSVDLCDSIKYVLTKKADIKLWSNMEEMESQSNLIYKVASFLQRTYRPDAGVEIFLEKNIPLAAGLGGGSSNAAVTLRTLNRLWELNLDMLTLDNIAAGFGSDINFFLRGGTALGSGRGEVITSLPDAGIGNILLVNPGLRISAGEAYGLVKEYGAGSEPGASCAPFCWFNRLEAGIRMKYPIIDRLIIDLEEFGAKPALMSGSGSTCIGVFHSVNKLEAC